MGAGLSRPEPPILMVNGTPVELTMEHGYARLARRWQKGDVVQLDLPMPIRRVWLTHSTPEQDRPGCRP